MIRLARFALKSESAWSLSFASVLAIFALAGRPFAMHPCVAATPSWVFDSTIVYSELAPLSGFGYATALDEDTALIGRQGTTSSGDVTILELNGQEGRAQTRLQSPIGYPGDGFATSVDIENGVAIAGAWSRNSAIVYRKTGGEWQTEQSLSSDISGSGAFGNDVKLSGKFAVVGAPTYSTGNSGVGSGAVFVFEDYDGNWTQTAKILPDSVNSRLLFGYSVEIEHNTLAVTQRDGNDEGAVSIYGLQNGQWSLQQFIPNPGSGRPQFGRDISLSSAWMAIGAPRNDSWRGGVYMYHFDGESWKQHSFLSDPEGTEWDFFGAELDLNGNQLVVGAASDPQDTMPQGGAAFVYQFDGSNWLLQQKLQSPNPVARAQFGRSVSIDGRFILVGEKGAVHVFTAVPEPSTMVSIVFCIPLMFFGQIRLGRN
jgi:hypothetical protein